MYEFEDYNKDGTIDFKDQQNIQNPASSYYGGITNSFVFNSFELSFLFNFLKQIAFAYVGRFPPGNQGNQPLSVLDRWKKPGDISEQQYFS